ncbi:MAG TPA: YIP1 family protein [Vicinamibacterales bacterium]|nr:YIP1 family protein [Vicinamibacterales bacterium]
MTDIVSASDQSQGKASPSPGLFARVIGVLMSPRETYAAVASRPRWLGIMVLTIAVTALAYYALFSSPAIQDAFIDQWIRASGDTVSDEQIAGFETIGGYLPVMYAASVVVLGPLIGAAIAGIMMWIFTTLMGGNATFKQVFAVMNHAGVVSMLSPLLAAAMIAGGVEPNGVRLPGANLGVFVPMLEETSFVAVMLSAIDLILVWWLVSLAIGLGVLYKRRTGPIATTFLGLYALFALLIAFVSSGS